MSGHRLVGVEHMRVGRATVVHLSGEIDRLTVPELERLLREMLAGAEDVVVGLRGVSYLDLGGVALIERLADAAQAAGRAFVLAEAPPAVQRILRILELDRTLTVVPTAGDAFARLGIDAPPPDGSASTPAPSPMRDPSDER